MCLFAVIRDHDNTANAFDNKINEKKYRFFLFRKFPEERKLRRWN